MLRILLKELWRGSSANESDKVANMVLFIQIQHKPEKFPAPWTFSSKWVTVQTYSLGSLNQCYHAIECSVSQLRIGF